MKAICTLIFMSYGFAFSLIAAPSSTTSTYMPPSSIGKSPVKPSSTIKSIELQSEQKKAPHPTQPKQDFTPRALPPGPMPAATVNYFYPGLVVFREGGWQGGEHLYNLTNNISVYVEIIKPETEELGINGEEIKQKIEGLFRENGINPFTLSEFNQPPLPFFRVEILVYPLQGGYAASCHATLFESVNLKRFNLEQGTAFQAITWEKKSLLIFPKDDAKNFIEKGVLEMAQSFIERFQFYDRIRKAQK
jgi:hypothetical protein